MKHTHEKGFTLVELAIVMTIIGLLIGGILKGQELMENARVTSTIAQVKSYEAATTTFRDSFSAIPGDMANANTRLPNCTDAACFNSDATTAGNSRIGPLGGLTADNSALVTPAVEAQETTLFWSHLLLADLIAGVTDTYARGTVGNPTWGESHPAAKIGGGFIVGHADNSAEANFAGGNQPSGTFIALVNAPDTSITVDGGAQGAQAVSPLRAAQIDRKMDDGQAQSGFVRGYGVDAADGCFDSAAVAPVLPNTYLETLTAKNCGVVFRIQG